MKYILTLILILQSTLLFSQIGEVKVNGHFGKIYNTKSVYIGNIYINDPYVLVGYNDKWIVITNAKWIKIYDSRGCYTGFYIYEPTDCQIQINNQFILIKEGNRTKYYDFKGSFTGKYTLNK
jgi:hypothetical protein